MELRSFVVKLWGHEFFRFLVTGGINTVFGYSVYSLLTFIGLHYTLVVLLGQISGILFNFNTTGRIVFNNTNPRLLYRFAVVYLVMYILNVFFLGLLVRINFNMYFSGAILILPMALVSLFLFKIFVFSNNH